MAQQLTDNLFLRGGYVDEVMSVETFSDLSSLSATKKFVGLTVTVKNALTSDAGKSIPVNVWLSEGRGNTNWVIKDIAPIDNLSQLNVIPEGFLPVGFRIALKNGNSFIYKGVDDESQKQWEAEIRQEEFDKTVADAVELAIDNITSGASEAFDTLKEVEEWINTSGISQEWIKEQGFIKEHQDISHLAISADVASTIEDIKRIIPSIEGLATETFVTDEVAKVDRKVNTLSGAVESINEEINAKISAIYTYQGSVARYSLLPSNLTSDEIGHVYNVEESHEDIPAGTNYAWNGEEWNSLAGMVDLTPYAKKEDLNNLATKEELLEFKNKIPSLDGVAREEWVNNQGFIKEHQDISHLATSADVVSIIDEVKESIPSIDGLASEIYVKNAIAEAKLSGNTNIDLTGYATKDDIKDLASKDEIKTYTEGTSIYIDNENKISVKIAADTEEKNNFIEINENNELELNTITLDAAVISEDIEVNGGAWADEVETVFDGKIPAGITFEDFLKRMLKREKFVNDFYTDRTFNVYAKEINPGLFYADKDVNNQIVEVGTKVTVKQFEPTSTKAEQSLTAGTFTYGYKVGEGGEYNSSQIYEEKITPNLISSGSILQVLCTNLTEDIEGTKPIENIYVNKANGDVMTIDTINAYVNKGYNSIKICQTGDTYAANTNIKGNNIYVATSLKKYQNSNGEDNVYNITFPESEMTATNQVVYQVTGASKYYIGGINEYSNDYWNSNRSNEIINLEKSGWAIEDEIEVPYTFKVNTKQQTVAVPSEYTKVFGRDRLSGPVEFNLVKGSMNFYNSQGHVSQYNVFVAPVIDGLSVDSFITIIMSKK
jgi:hypothetical protein